MDQHRRSLLGLVAALSVSACSPLAVLNGLSPSDTYEAQRDIAYGDHSRQRLDVYRPVGARGPAPVVVFFYGGNWASGDKRDYLFVGEALAASGYVAVLPDYRLYPEVRFPEFLADSARAVRWTLDNLLKLGGDPARVFVMGHSAGAYNAAMLALNPAYLKAAGTDRARLRGWIGLAGPYDFLPLTGETTKRVFGFPDTQPSTQPIAFASAGAPPALLITGDGDDVVDPGNSRRLAARLRANGADVREIVYPGVGHRMLVGAFAAPLRDQAPVLVDLRMFVDATAIGDGR